MRKDRLDKNRSRIAGYQGVRANYREPGREYRDKIYALQNNNTGRLQNLNRRRFPECYFKVRPLLHNFRLEKGSRQEVKRRKNGFSGGGKTHSAGVPGLTIETVSREFTKRANRAALRSPLSRHPSHWREALEIHRPTRRRPMRGIRSGS